MGFGLIHRDAIGLPHLRLNALAGIDGFRTLGVDGQPVTLSLVLMPWRALMGFGLSLCPPTTFHNQS